MLDQAREAARSSQQAVGGAVPEKDRVLLPEILVDPDVVLVLSLVIGSGVNGVIPGAI